MEKFKTLSYQQLQTAVCGDGIIWNEGGIELRTAHLFNVQKHPLCALQAEQVRVRMNARLMQRLASQPTEFQMNTKIVV